MSPKLNLKAVGQELLPQQRETFYRNTQPTFHISLEKTAVNKRNNSNKRNETPKLDSTGKSKGRDK